MANCKIPAHYPNQIDITRAPLAFGNRAVPRLNRELQDKDSLITRQRALRSLCDYLHDPEHIASSINEGIPNSLKELLTDADPFCRYKSAECLFVLSCNSNGRKAIINEQIIPVLAQLFEDEEVTARKNAHKAIEMVSELPFGAEAIVELKLIERLVDRLQHEIDEVILSILDTIHFCMLVDTKQALAAGAMAVFTKLLTHDLPAIKSKAARDIFDLSIPLEGKQEALTLETVPILASLLDHEVVDVRSKATLALEALELEKRIAITTPGKYACLKAEVIPILVRLLKDDLSEMRVNALKLMSCVSEAPEGRRELLNHIEEVKNLVNDQVPIVAKHAQIAVRVITWKP